MSDPLACLRALLPGRAVAAGGPVAALQQPLWPGEAAALTRARAPRRADFTAGRSAARAALALLGHEPAALPRDPRGPAIWPAGVAGSISHGAGWAMAIAAPAAAQAALGLDVEGAGAPLPLPEIARPEEIAALGSLDPVVLFSAKEAAYKAQFALSGRMLGFHDLVVTFDGAAFAARLAMPGRESDPANRVTGRWGRAGALILAVAAIPARSVRGNSALPSRPA
ncbi:MAG: phosphopantetheinyl transferase [Rubellimicrobium sp.]|nr:phosphopantetheinyl transferase [Rubellimicrobium sp.]